MSIIDATYPLSAIVALLLFIIALLCSMTNIMMGAIFLFLAYMDCISLMPIIKILDDCISVLFKDTIAKIKNNIRESFPVHGNTYFKGQAIYLFHPHGLFSLALAFHVSSTITDWPYRNTKATVLSLMTHLPLVKDFASKRVVSSNYYTMKEVLQSGTSLGVALGGLAEAKYIEQKKLTVIASTRKGIFKMAIETGVPIIPVLTYGENAIYRKMDSRIADLIEYFFRIQVPVPTVASWKAWFKIYKEPLENKIETHIGEAIDIGKARTPTEAEIVELRNRYIEGLKELYVKTRPADYEEELYVL
jgi:Diacylglycerol acyltransferase